MPVISVCESPFTGYDGIVKRASDLILSLLILILVSPLLILIAVAIKMDSPGPIIFNRDFPIELNFYWKPLENHHDFIEV
jgi:putative colanic acid biosynthesis UDP-glucose lipid carrier transferase